MDDLLNTLTTPDIDNPYTILDGTGQADHVHYTPIGVPSAYSWVDFYQIMDQGTISAGAQIQVYGQLPHQAIPSNRKWPMDFNSNYLDVDDPETGMWVQLPNVADADGALTYTTTTMSSTLSVNATDYVMYAPSRFLLKGCIRVLPIVGTLPTTAGTPNVAVLGAVLHG
jgi:hypothetical protein